MEKDYLIAGLHVRMDTWGRTEEQAEMYRVDYSGEPDLVVLSSAKYIKDMCSEMDDDAREYLATGAYFYRHLVEFDALLIHSSAVVMDGYAYLFSAPCGTGKSTHTTMWREAFGYDKVLMLNDDKPAVRLENGRWYAYGTPWSGKTAQNLNIRVPIGGICMLARGEVNEIVPFGGIRAVQELLEQTYRSPNGAERGKLMELLDQLLKMVPVWKLHCTPTVEAAMVSHKAMAEEAQKRFG